MVSTRANFLLTASTSLPISSCTSGARHRLA